MPQPGVRDLCIEETIWSTEKEQMKEESVQNIRPKIQIYLNLFKNQTSENMTVEIHIFAKKIV